MITIKEAWIEEDPRIQIFKLAVRFDPDTGVENFGCFGREHPIVAAEFVGLTHEEARNKFIDIVYR